MQPNILWLMTDEQRVDSLGYSGSPWAQSPHLDRLADRGVRFHAAYTPSPVCVAARASLLTGRPASSTGVLNNHHRFGDVDPGFLIGAFAEAGYQTASFGKSHYNCSHQAFGVEGGRVLGDRVGYFGYEVDVDAKAAGTVLYEGGKSPWMFAGRFPGSVDETPEMLNVQDALMWLDGRDADRPFFLRVSFNAPHTPVCPPVPFDTCVAMDAIDLPMDFPETMTWRSQTEREHLHAYAGSHRLTETQIRRARQAYLGQCVQADHCFGFLLNAMREDGALENTIVAFLSDHGTHLGDHGFFQKQSFYEASAHVPFFMCGPGVPEHVDVEDPVTIGGLLPTLMELVNVGIPERAEFQSLVPQLHGERVDVPVFSEIDHGLWKYRSGERRVMVRDGQYKLMLYRDPSDPSRIPLGQADMCLFDLETDADERANLADNDASASVVVDLIGKIDAWDAERAIQKPRVKG